MSSSDLLGLSPNSLENPPLPPTTNTPSDVTTQQPESTTQPSVVQPPSTQQSKPQEQPTPAVQTPAAQTPTVPTPVVQTPVVQNANPQQATTTQQSPSEGKASEEKKTVLGVGDKKRPLPGKSEDSTNGRWSSQEDDLLRLAVEKLGAKNWKKVSSEFLRNTRTDVQCLHRWQKVLKPGLVKGPWTKEEDETIVNCRKRGITKWSEIANHVTGRIGKQCRERWFNHLDPNIRRCEWTEEEDRKLIEGQALLGNKWTQIAKLFLPGRPENAVKNRWNAATRRRIGTKKKVQIDSNNRNLFLSESAEQNKQDYRKMRPFTKTQARFRQIRPTQDFKDLGNAMDGMVDMAMKGFKVEDLPEETTPKRRRKTASVSTVAETLSFLSQFSNQPKASFKESRPSELIVKSESKPAVVLETPKDSKPAQPPTIAISPTKAETKTKKKDKVYFKDEEFINKSGETVPQLVI